MGDALNIISLMLLIAVFEKTLTSDVGRDKPKQFRLSSKPNAK